MRLCRLIAIALALFGTAVLPARADIASMLNPFAEYQKNIPRAAQANDVGRVRTLLLDGVSPNQTEETSGASGMHIAASSGNLQILAVLYKAGADINQRDKIGNTPLHNAADHAHVEAVKLLLDLKANVDAENKNGMTALMFAAKAGDADSVRALLAHGANPNKADYTGRDAVGWAMESHRQFVVRTLKDAAATKH
jgi:ankyrin repeat protein